MNSAGGDYFWNKKPLWAECGKTFDVTETPLLIKNDRVLVEL